MTRRQFAWCLAGLIGLAALLRSVYPTADPPWNPGVGVVWHDEGAWTHNARNRALYGAWVQDEWNPLYIAPVFTVLEYVSFAAFGVGLWQARLVSEVTGLLSVLVLSLGVARLAGREAGLVAGALLGSNYVYAMYNRAATMEASMAAFIVGAWYAYARADARAAWGWIAALCALLAFFTKAAAVFFLLALALDALIAVIRPTTPGSRAAGRATLVGLAVCSMVALAVFVLPHWSEYRFYNWQVSVTRKPSYDLGSVLDRLTWFPVLHDIFTRMWVTTLLAVAALFAMLARAPRLAPAERLLGLWVTIGSLELLAHDVGNERRFVFLVPAVAALAAIVLVRERRLARPELAEVKGRYALLLLVPAGYAMYVLAGSAVRLLAIYQIRPGVRVGAFVTVAALAFIALTWPALAHRLARERWSVMAGLLLAGVLTAGQLAQFIQWAAGRTYKNYAASLELGRRLPPGTLVHGKLANGLSLDSRIRPIFVGRGFGNYEDRRQRDDVRYILTYVAPRIGYEGPVIEEVLEAYPNRTIVMTFDVAETPTGHDRAALIDKFGAGGGSGGR
ncbi:MAG TPA: glycosyltransferase family 39 protein [Vicinamibacterales bacterium]|nr:glycosyltransferase family 39 protein [Vicinamibacterales bacterium]